ncbi:hypothetical protein OFR22_13775 [Brachyspira hyodysenteriae]|uniref:hypothetical protein n=1 Tax=Brachyspira hyodysenteriae TaxID=159 RepID=UPI0022CD63DA|nr:hypothetical protein [Brachyspira hyodysenteriae]MCZ9838836.1 hypothetical protein [Brachyspira hyodysenteriae]MCZ9848124.1 hypothetical protein [Brachyspira hyodysenteriae]MCZ9851828.1 hypothetical protein [Brachyspira hyodysenteriae]MCZ9859434.1 hypothetical protein [Brachyspira hyodysenteriae]MCZ9870658.1 hypothetical protein [Brachyspira hyodysenteriae]
MKNVISIIAAFILITAVISCGGGNKETDQTSQNNNTQSQNIQTNTSQTNNQKEFFDMKYVYKGIRADKAKFDEKLKKLRENNEYAKRNFDFLNRKFANDDERKKYSIEFISNVNYAALDLEFLISWGNWGIYSEVEDYYAVGYLYVDQNLALKKAREELLKLNKKDADVYLALFLSHFACDSLYYFEEEKKYLTEWKKAGGTNISMMIAKYDDDNAYSNKMKLVNYIIEAPDSLRAEKLVADAYKDNFYRYIVKDNGYIDLFNENNYSLTSIELEGTARLSSVKIAEEIGDTNIINKYIKTYINNRLANDDIEDYLEYYQNYYNINAVYCYDGWNNLNLLEFKKNTFLIESTMKGLVNMHYYNPEFIKDNLYASFKEIKNYNFRLGDIDKVESAEINSISTNDLKDYTKDSKFIDSGSFDIKQYSSHVASNMYYPLHSISFFLCDINNDGKEELMLSGEYTSSAGRGGIAHYTLLLKDNLEIDFDSEAGQFINDRSFQDLECTQKIYTENGNNKILLLDTINNEACDIFIDNNEIKNADYFDYITYSYQPKLEWKGSILNGVPEGALKTDASFDMSKAENASDKAIVSDRTLRVADKLISDAYFAKRATLDKQGQEELLEQRRSEIKAIQEAKGDIKAIESKMLKILNIQ